MILVKKDAFQLWLIDHLSAFVMQKWFFCASSSSLKPASFIRSPLFKLALVLVRLDADSLFIQILPVFIAIASASFVVRAILHLQNWMYLPISVTQEKIVEKVSRIE